MHPAYHPIHRRTRIRWVVGALAAYALLEVAMEVWDVVRPRAKYGAEVDRIREAGW